MNKFNYLNYFFLGIAILTASAANAHHSFATHYDTTNIVEVNGVFL